MAQNINLGTFVFDGDKMQTRIDELTHSLRDLEKAKHESQQVLSQLNKEYREATKDLERLEKVGKKGSAEWNNQVEVLNKLSNSIIEHKGDMKDLNSAISTETSQRKKLQTELDKVQKGIELVSKAYDFEGKSIEELRADRQLMIALRNKEVAVMGEQSEQAQKLNRMIEQSTNQEKKLVAETEKRFYQIGDYANQLEGHFGSLQDAIKELASGNVIGALTQLRTAVNGLFTSFSAFIATPIGALIAGLVALGAAVKYIWDYNASIKENLYLTRELLNVQGEVADSARQMAESISQAYGKEFKENIEVAKSLMQDFKISSEDALNAYSDGLVRGGQHNKEFEDSIREYGELFAQNGYSAKEFLDILNAGYDLDIYTDKLPDAIKEAGISLQEQTKATSTALTNAFGASFTDDILKRVRTGETTVKDALEEISKKSKETHLDNQQLAQLTADIFRGAGEDAGGALMIFKALNLAVEDGQKPLTDLQQATEEYRKSIEDLEEAKDRVFKSDKMLEFQSHLKTFWNNFLTRNLRQLEIAINLITFAVDYLKIGVNSLGDAFTQTFNDIKNSVANFSMDNVVKSIGNVYSALTSGRKNFQDSFNEGVNKRIQDNLTDQVNRTILESTKSIIQILDPVANKRPIKDSGSSSATKTSTPKTKGISEAEKARKEAEQQLAREVQNEKKRLQDIADLQADHALRELNNQIKNSQSKLANEKLITKALLDEEIQRLDQVSALQQQANKQELDAKLAKIEAEKQAEKDKINALKINEDEKQKFIETLNAEAKVKDDLARQEYNQKELENTLFLEQEKTRVKNEYEAIQKEQDLIKKQLEQEARFLEIETNARNEWELQKRILDEQYQEKLASIDQQYADGIINEENYLKALTNLQTQWNDDVRLMDEAVNEAKLQGAQSVFGSLKGLFKENTLAYKAMAIGEATISTYLSATKALAEVPWPMNYVVAGANIAMGLANVAKIVGVKQSKAEGGYTGDGGMYDKAFISGNAQIHRGEQVWSQQDLSMAGGIDVMEAIRPTSRMPQSQKANVLDNLINSASITNAIMEGTIRSAGTIAQAVREGSYSGTQQGSKDLATDRKLLNETKY